MMKSLAITVAVAAVILIAAFATLAVLSAIAGQESGLEKSTAVRCAPPHPAAAHAATHPAHGERPAAHAGCTTRHS